MRLDTAIRAGALSLAALLLSSQVLAQSTKDRLSRLEQQMSRVERLLENGQDIQTDTLARLRELQAENQELRNQLETLQFEAERASERQRQLYMDLDSRFQALEAGLAAGRMPGAAGGDAAAPVSDAAAYQAAFDLLKDSQYDKAGAGFTAFLKDFPNSDLRDNAQYWLAETHYVNKAYTKALEGFRAVVSEYPSSRKVPDAWLKIGYCNYELKNWSDARQALSTVASQFPDSTAARLARERITLMDQNGV